MSRRTYRLGKRAASQEDTRRRITEAAVELHGSVGPARTTVAEIARRAGVQRLTVYTHFPDLTSLFAACTTHWFGEHPPPDAAAWQSEAEPALRVGKAIGSLYAYYSANRQMFANWLRDAELIPELKPFAEGGYYDFVAQMRDQILDEPACSTVSRLGMLVALQFDTWRTLTDREGLNPKAAAAAMTQLLVCGAG